MATTSKGSGQIVTELKELLVTYAKQETVDPLKTLGRYLGFGLGGAVCMAISGVFLSLALLRALQTQTGTRLTGNWSWVPYLGTLLVVSLVVGGLVAVVAKVKSTNMPKREKIS